MSTIEISVISYMLYLTLALAHVRVLHRTSPALLLARPHLIIVSQRDCSFRTCGSYVPSYSLGRKLDAMISAFLSDPLISIERFSTLEILGSMYKGALMKLSTGWRADKTRKNRARATRKPKIRWEVLGLPSPLDTSLTTSMEDIRLQVSNMASRGFGQGTRSRTAEREAKTTSHAPDSSSKRRRGATESSQS